MPLITTSPTTTTSGNVSNRRRNQLPMESPQKRKTPVARPSPSLTSVKSSTYRPLHPLGHLRPTRGHSCPPSLNTLRRSSHPTPLPFSSLISTHRTTYPLRKPFASRCRPLRGSRTNHHSRLPPGLSSSIYLTSSVTHPLTHPWTPNNVRPSTQMLSSPSVPRMTVETMQSTLCGSSLSLISTSNPGPSPWASITVPNHPAVPLPGSPHPQRHLPRCPRVAIEAVVPAMRHVNSRAAHLPYSPRRPRSGKASLPPRCPRPWPNHRRHSSGKQFPKSRSGAHTLSHCTSPHTTAPTRAGVLRGWARSEGRETGSARVARATWAS